MNSTMISLLAPGLAAFSLLCLDVSALQAQSSYDKAYEASAEFDDLVCQLRKGEMVCDADVSAFLEDMRLTLDSGWENELELVLRLESWEDTRPRSPDGIKQSFTVRQRCYLDPVEPSCLVV